MKRGNEMELLELVKDRLNASGRTYNDLGDQMGLGRNVVYNAITRKGVTYNNAIRVLNELGYDVVAVPRAGITGGEVTLKCASGTVESALRGKKETGTASSIKSAVSEMPEQK